jgi:hypothetical protein
VKIRFAKEVAVENLRASIGENLDRYRKGDFTHLDLDSSQHLELQVEANNAALKKLKFPSGDEYFEVANCLAVHDYLSELTPYDARDERLWVYLSHTVFLEYGRARWPIPVDDEEAVRHIETHFFARTNRQVERDNVASRLWWMAHLCTRLVGVNQKAALEAFLYRADVRASIIERPTVAQSTKVFSVIVKGLIQSATGKKALFERSTFRKVMVELNSIGGFRLLDALPEAELDKIFCDVLTKRVGIAVV